jgi:undecaprenyl-diphosphatase
MRRSTTLLVIAVVMVAFALLAGVVAGGRTQRFDDRVLVALRDSAGPPWLREAVRDLSALGSEVVLTLLVLSVTGFLLLSGRGRGVPPLLVAAAGGFALSEGLKAVIARPRPEVVPHLSWTWSTSFPSGHAMLSTVVWLSLALLLAGLTREPRRKALLVALAGCLAVLVGVSRVYLGVHYPTDVMGGWAAGTVWALSVHLAFRRRAALG